MRKELARKKLAVIGLGTLGSRQASLLLKCRPGELVLVDRDYVEEKNLEMQALYTRKDIGSAKALALAKHLKQKGTKITPVVADISHLNISLLKSDLILDCTDNLETRFLLNEYCIKEKIPWVHASALASKGTVMPVVPGEACFRCVIPEARNLHGCDTSGILPKTADLTASLQLDAAINLLEGSREQYLLWFDIFTKQFHKLKVKKRKSCPACAGKEEYLSGKKISQATRLCGKGLYQVKGQPVSLRQAAARLSKIMAVKRTAGCVHTKKLTLFSDGRALVKAVDEAEARAIYSRLLG